MAPFKLCVPNLEFKTQLVTSNDYIKFAALNNIKLEFLLYDKLITLSAANRKWINT